MTIVYNTELKVYAKFEKRTQAASALALFFQKTGKRFQFTEDTLAIFQDYQEI